MQILGMEVEAEKFDELICEQNKGKKLEIVDGNIVAVNYEPTEQEKKIDKIQALENWFSEYFDYQLRQSMWQSNFVVSYDDYFKKTYIDIDELKQQAEVVRAEIKALRAEV